MPRVEITEAADRDISEIYVYSHRRYGEAQAERYLLGLDACFERLAEMPRMGRNIDHIRTGYFRFEHARHTIFYIILKDGIRIVRVLHASMDPQRHLEG
ncbi:MAG TPA: type II toxin-antitoxin system RelE/ParE family toxin [Beijerinckiaceae bacterium]|jgi:toxin ParE1/3/4